MDTKALLEDLHFQLSSSSSNHVRGGSKQDHTKENKLRLDIEDRTRMTANWVAHLRNRHRSLSSDSHFGAVSVCDKLKKSFLKPCTVTEEDMEDLRIKLAQMNLKDTGISIDDLKLKLDQVELGGKNERPFLQRFRSRTVPLYGLISSDVGTNVTENAQENEGQQHETAICNLACVQPTKKGIVYENLDHSKQSVNKGDKHEITIRNLTSLSSLDLIKDSLFDENHNQITPSVPASDPGNIKKSKSDPQIFRNENLVPTVTDLKGPKIIPTVSPNKIIGCYENEEDYLKTQFYLLKEDFIGPLKEGIEHYKKLLRTGNIPADVRNLKLYHNVRITEPVFKEDKLGLAINMGYPLSEKIGEKDFMDGSLVLITPNHFKDIYVGTVVSRKFVQPTPEGEVQYPRRSRRRRSNILILQLHGTSHFDPALKNRKVLLAESQAFFQPYYYVMKIFQGMSADDLPLKEYILGPKSNIAITSPSYLPKDAEYLLDATVKVNVTNPATWPKADVLNVNDSQLSALKKALSEKLVLIQGPPGTGKTYLGSKVAKALLQNSHVWNKKGNQPMLLMCQTNHALDQFMELLIPVSKNLIRVGCQSKSDILAPYNIREWVKKGGRKASKQSNVKDLIQQMKTLASNIQAHHTELIRIVSHGVLDLQTLVSMNIMDLNHAGCFISSEHFLMWLEEARNCQVSHSSKEELEDVGKTFTDCVKHGKLSTSTDSHEVKASDFDDQSSTLIEVDPGSSSMRNLSIKYVISFPDFEEALKKKLYAPEKPQSKNQRQEMEERLKFLKICISENIPSEDENELVMNHCLWTVAPHVRCVLYRFWVKKLERNLQSHLQLLESHYITLSSAYADLKLFQKLEVMRQADIVGMTTSAAARLYPILCKLQCPIALVEEAAEVHESHIVATVTKHCQHLILLGDHKQLRPRPASYTLSKTHFTDVSLFERLILNKAVAVSTLLTQHRMQPQISALIKPSIYAELYDHDSTRERQDIFNMQKNVYFLSHHWQDCKNLLTGSYSNPQEARMAVQLLRYLLIEEYSVNEICILAAYREQVNELEANCKLYPELSGVRLSTIDNFQGEECRIVILSLVRNNYQNQIGFLKIENRVCVALSRARDGLFILGSIELLSHNSELWMSVHGVLKRKNLVGQSIPLSCRRHPQKKRNVSQPDEFSQYINAGGCRQICLYKLPCGHFCRKKCHSDDAQHVQHRCEEPCENTCAFGHKCKKQCSEKCGDCDCICWKLLACGHWAFMRCNVEPSDYLCEAAVKKCMVPCSHEVNLQCWMPSISCKYCPNQCPSLLKCGHRCPVRCNALKHPNHLEVKCCQNTDEHGFISRSKFGKASNCG